MSENLTGKRIRLKRSAIDAKWGDEWLVVDVTGGFGAGANPGGKMFARHVEDGSTTYYRGHDVDEVLGDVPADEAEFDYAVSFTEGDGIGKPLGTFRAPSDTKAVELASEAAGGHGGPDFFGRLVFTGTDGKTHIASAVRVR